MSTSVDNRIVSMEFDNHKFERNAEATMKTLDKLEASLQFKDAGKGLDKVGDKIKNVDVSPLSKGLDEVSGKFSALEIAGITAIANVTNRLVDAAIKISKSLTIDQITEGFSKYEQKMTAVQTIMNATGESLENVEEVINKLAQYSDDTSYNLATMVDALSKFTSYGVPIKEAGEYILGVGNIAGFSGAKVQDATHAFEGFAKTVGQTHMSLQVWKSWMTTAHVNGTKIKETFIDAAVAAKTLKRDVNGVARTAKGTAVTVGTFDETLREGWLNTNKVTKKVLRDWASYTVLVQDLASVWKEANGEYMSSFDVMTMMQEGYEDNEQILKAYQYYLKQTEDKEYSLEEATVKLKESINELSKKGYESGTVYRTFTDAIEAAKDAVSTGWSNIMQNILGDAETSKELWTTVGEILLEVFATPVQDLAEITSYFAEVDGIKLWVMYVTELKESLDKLVEPFKYVFETLFPPKTFEEIGLGFANVISKIIYFNRYLALGHQEVEALKKILLTILSPLKPIVDVLKNVGLLILRVVVGIRELVRQGLRAVYMADSVGAAFEKIFGGTLFGNVYKNLKEILSSIGDVIFAIVSKIFELFSYLGKSIDIPIGSVVLNIYKISDAIKHILVGALDSLLNIIKSIDIGGFVKLLGTAIGAVSQFFVGIGNKVANAFGIVSGVFANIRTAVESFFKTLLSFNLDSIKQKWNDLVNSISTSGLSEIKTKWFDKLGEILSKIRTFGQKVFETTKSIASRIDMTKVVVGALILSIIGLVNKFKKLTSNLIHVTDAVTDFIRGEKAENTIVPVILSISLAVATLTAALYVLSTKVDPEKLKTTAIAISGVIGAMALSSVVMGVLAKYLDLKDGMVGFAVVMASFAASMLMLGNAFDKVKEMAWVEVKRSIVFMAGMTTAIVIAMKFLSKNSPMMLTTAIGLFAFSKVLAGAIEGLTNATVADKFQKIIDTFLGLVDKVRSWILDSRDLGEFIKTEGQALVLSIIAFVGSFLLINTLGNVGSIFTKLAGGLMGITVCMLLLTKVIDKLKLYTSEELDTYISVIGKMAGILGGLIAVLQLTAIGEKRKFNPISTAVSIAGLVLCMDMLIGLVDKIDKLNSIDWNKSVVMLASIAGLISGIVAVLQLTATGMKPSGMWATVVILLETFAAISMLEKVSVIGLYKIILAMITIVLSFVTLIRSLAIAAKESKRILFGSISIGVLFAEIIAALLIVNQIADIKSLETSWKAMAGVCAAIGLFAVEFSVAMKLMENAKSGNGFRALGTTFLGLVEVVGALWALNAMGDLSRLAESSKGLSILMASIGAFIIEYSAAAAIANQTSVYVNGKADWTSNVSLVISSVVALLGSVGGLLQFKDIDKFKEAMPGLTDIMNALGKFLISVAAAAYIMPTTVGLKAFGDKIGGLALLTAEFGALIFVMAKFLDPGDLAKFNGMDKSLQNVAAALGVFAILAAIAARIVGVASMSVFLKVAGIIGIFIVVFGLLTVALSFIPEEVSISDGAKRLEEIADAIGNFVARLGASLISGGLSTLSTNITNFATGLSEFSDAIKKLDQDDLDKTGILVEITRDLIGVDLEYTKNGVINFWTMAAVKKAISNLTDILVSFIEALNGVSVPSNLSEILTGFSLFINALPGLVSVLKEDFGITTNLKFAGLKKGLISLADAMIGMSGKLSEGEVDFDAINSTIKAATDVMNLLKDFDDQNFIQKLFEGDDTLEGFSSQIGALASAMASFGEKASTIDFPKLTLAITCLSDLVKIMNEIPNSDGIAQIWSGNRNMYAFGAGLTSIASGLSSFGTELTEFNYDEHVKDGIAVLKDLAKASEYVPTVVNAITGTNNLSEFGTGIGNLGVGLSFFCAQLIGVDKEKIATAAESFESLSSMVSVLRKEGTIKFFYDYEASVQAFIANAPSFGQAITDFSNNADGIKTEKLEAIEGFINTYADIAIKLDSFVYTSMGYFVDDLPALADAIRLFTTKLTGVADEDVTRACSNISKIAAVFDDIKTLGSVKLLISSFNAGMQNVASSGIDAFVTKFIDADSKIDAAIAHFATHLDTKLGEITNTYVNIGKFWTAGVALGILDPPGIQTIERNAALAANTIIDTTNKTLDINSPSGEGEYSGKMFTWGEGLGLLDPSAKRVLMSNAKLVNNELETTATTSAAQAGASGAAGFFSGFSDNLSNLLDTYAPGIKDTINTFAGSVLGQSLISSIAGVNLGSILSSGPLFGDGGTDEENDPFGFQHWLEGIQETVEETTNVVVPEINDIETKTGGAAKKAAKTVAQLTEEYKLCSDSVQGLYNRHKDTFDLIGGATGKSGWDIAHDRVWAYGEALWEATQTTDQLAKVTAGDADAIEAKFKGVKEALDKIYTEAVAKFSKLTEVIFKDEEAEGPAGDLWGYKSRYEEQAKNYEKYVNNMEKLHDKVVSLQLDREIWKRAYDAGPDDTSFLEQALGMDDKHLKEISDTIQASFSKESELGRRLTDLDYDLGYASSQAQADGMIAGSIEMVNAGTATVEECIAAMTQAVLTGDIPEAAKKLLEGFITGFEENRYALSTESTTVMQEDVQKPVETVMSKSNGEYHGYLLLQGMIEGIRENASRLQEAIATTMAEADEAYKSDPHVKEGSPSRHWKEHGRFLMMGLAQGIITNGRTVTNAIGEVNSFIDTATVEAFNAAIDLLDTSGLNNPVITPTLDLTEVKKGVRGMSSMFEDSKIAASGIQNGSLNNEVGKNGITQVFNQNNYSPKALDRLTIYRQSRNQFAQMKEALGQL